MKDLALFAIASQRNHWLAARSSALASNIANADTPGFKAKDVPAFEAALEAAGTQMQRTSADHLSASDSGSQKFELLARPSGVGKHSGNTVGLEAELTALGDARSQHMTVTGIVGAFHRMLLSSSKG